MKCRNMATMEGRQCHTKYVERYRDVSRDEQQGHTSIRQEHPLPNKMQRLMVHQLDKTNKEEERDITDVVRMETDSTKNFTSSQSGNKMLFGGLQ